MNDKGLAVAIFVRNMATYDNDEQFEKMMKKIKEDGFLRKNIFVYGISSVGTDCLDNLIFSLSKIKNCDIVYFGRGWQWTTEGQLIHSICESFFIKERFV